MITPFLNGFVLAFSLIFAVGAQNVFVLRQGLLKNHLLAVIIFCSISDTILIFSGIYGMSILFPDSVIWIKPYFFLFASIWLSFYALARLKSAILNNTEVDSHEKQKSNFWKTMASVSLITFANPHVYLDTVLLIGTVSLKYNSIGKFSYGLGAAISSYVFFFSIGYGAQVLLPIFKNPRAWRLLDFTIAIIMFSLAISMLKAGKLI